MDLCKLPLEIENLILEYKYSAEHFDKFKNCIKIIKSITHKYYTYDEDGINMHESEKILGNIVTSYYLHNNYLEVDTYEQGSTKCMKYWCFEGNKIETYEDHT